MSGHAGLAYSGPAQLQPHRAVPQLLECTASLLISQDNSHENTANPGGAASYSFPGMGVVQAAGLLILCHGV